MAFLSPEALTLLCAGSSRSDFLEVFQVILIPWSYSLIRAILSPRP